MAAEPRYSELHDVPTSIQSASYWVTSAFVTGQTDGAEHGEQKMAQLYTVSRDLQRELSEQWRDLQQFRSEPAFAGMNSLLGGLSAALKQMDHVAQMYERVLALHKLQVSQMQTASRQWCDKFPKTQQEPSDDPAYLRMHDAVTQLCDRASAYVQSFDQALAGENSSAQPMVRESVRALGRAAAYRPVPAPCPRVSLSSNMRLRRVDFQVTHHPAHSHVEG